MSKTERLQNFAQSDTPSAVDVPRSWHGLLVWAVGRFGSGIVIAIACGWALSRVYEDHAAQTRSLMNILEQRARVDAEMSITLTQLRGAIDEMSKEARSAHRSIR